MTNKKMVLRIIKYIFHISIIVALTWILNATYSRVKSYYYYNTEELIGINHIIMDYLISYKYHYCKIPDQDEFIGFLLKNNLLKNHIGKSPSEIEFFNDGIYIQYDDSDSTCYLISKGWNKKRDPGNEVYINQLNLFEYLIHDQDIILDTYFDISCCSNLRSGSGIIIFENYNLSITTLDNCNLRRFYHHYRRFFKRNSIDIKITGESQVVMINMIDSSISIPSNACNNVIGSLDEKVFNSRLEEFKAIIQNDSLINFDSAYFEVDLKWFD